jgi:hypothetical protein
LFLVKTAVRVVRLAVELSGASPAEVGDDDVSIDLVAVAAPRVFHDCVRHGLDVWPADLLSAARARLLVHLPFIVPAWKRVVVYTLGGYGICMAG